MRHTFLKFPRTLISLVSGFILFSVVVQLPFVHFFDFLIATTIHNVRESFLDYGFVPFVIVGSIEVSVSGLFLFSMWLYRKGKFRKAYIVLAALLITTTIEFAMKQTLIHPEIPEEFRGRFPFMPFIGSADIETNYSFPSGHSLRSMLLFGTLFMWQIRTNYFLWFIIIYAVIQCAGMNYYGFHWTSEVFGGYWLAVIALYCMNRSVQNEL